MKIRFRVTRSQGGGYEGVVILPVGLNGAVKATAVGPTKTAALSTAAGLASKLLDSPILTAIMPPGTGAAVKATQLLASKGPAALKLLTGPGAERITEAFKSLKFW